MIKKMMLLAAAVAALVAFAAPAAAQANNPVITNVLGEPAEHITADGIEVVSTVTGGTKLECTTVGLTITLTQNTNGVASGHGGGFAVGNPKLEPSDPKYDAGDCRTSSGLGARITSVTVSNITLNAGGSGSATFGYTYDLLSGSTIIAECTFDGTASLEKTAADKIKLVSGALTGTSASPCPPNGTITGEFTLTDEFGEAATID